jgi:cellulose synthase/poly-beta-1,6-N-acetylglucosamine synthase-like glycosyltransferase
MLEFIQENYWGVACVGLCIAAWLVQMFYMFNYFLKASRTQNPGPTHIKPVSVIICARNEEKNLMENIPLIMEQDHPNFELVVVNDSSWDDTEAILKALSLRYPAIKVVNIDEEKQNMQGKKFALTLGIKAAKHETLLLTDADCVPVSPNWIREMTGVMVDKKQLAIGFSPYKKYPGWLNRIIRFDTLMIGCQYLGFAKAGKPYMGVGRNLAYTKDLFFKVGGFKNHYSIASGDDDLFVNQVANVQNTLVVNTPDAHTISEPKTTWKDWFVQKRRHFTTTPFYKSSHKTMLMLWPVSFLLMFVGFAGAMVFQTWMLLVSGLLLLRYIVQIAILHRVSARLAQSKDVVWLALPLEIHLHILNLGLYFTNLMRKPQKWN